MQVKTWEPYLAICGKLGSGRQVTGGSGHADVARQVLFGMSLFLLTPHTISYDLYLPVYPSSSHLAHFHWSDD